MINIEEEIKLLENAAENAVKEGEKEASEKKRLDAENKRYNLFCLFCFCGRLLSKELGIPIGILPTSGAGVDGNAPYQAILGYKQTSYLLGRFNPNTT